MSVMGTEILSQSQKYNNLKPLQVSQVYMALFLYSPGHVVVARSPRPPEIKKFIA